MRPVTVPTDVDCTPARMAVTGSGDAEADRVLVRVREVVAVDADAVREHVVVLERVRDFDTDAADVPLFVLPEELDFVTVAVGVAAAVKVVVAEELTVRVCVAEKVAV